MIKKLHPTLKACKCGYISTKANLYKHFEQVKAHYKLVHMSSGEFYADHGEVPLNKDDPRLDLQTQLEHSLTRQEKLATL